MLNFIPISFGATFLLIYMPDVAINDFKMPQLISAEKAAFFIFNGLHSSKFEIAFPSSFSKIMKLLKLLPHLSYLKLVGRKTGYHK